MESAVISTSIGQLLVAVKDGKIVQVSKVTRARKSTYKNHIKNPILVKAIQQINEYLTGERVEFDLPLSQDGTEFESEVWQQLRNIPYGQTCSYKEIASQINRPKAFRAVGSACGRNKLLLVIPCHRVVQSGGGIGGFGAGLPAKRKLLQLEACK